MGEHMGEQGKTAQTDTGAAGRATVPASLYRLTLEGLLTSSTKELMFRMLNRTVDLVRYDRAVLFTMDTGAPVLAGVSGRAEASKESELVSAWKKLAKHLDDPEQARAVTRISFPRAGKTWDGLSSRFPGYSAAWIPMRADGHMVAALWLERWAGDAWSSDDINLLQSLAAGYGGVWSKLEHGRSLTSRILRALRRKWVAMAMAAVLIVLLFMPVKLRVVAECEVVPDDPVVITAPLDGVVDEVPVDPGQKVQAGHLLFTYDKRVASEELKLARQQVRIIASGLERSRRQAFADAEARAEIALMSLRLEQEKIRLALAESNFRKLEVRSPVDGTVVVDDPFEWRGRPVMVGEKVLMVVNPEHTKLKIRISEDDNIPFDRDRPVKVVLNALPDRALSARLAYVAESVTLSPEGAPVVAAEAEWTDREPGLRMGLRGTAVTYGERVPFIYSALRKPFAAVRRLIGI